MKTRLQSILRVALAAIIILAFSIPQSLQAQRGGGRSGASKERTNASKPSGQERSGTRTRQGTSGGEKANTKPATNDKSNAGSRDVNSGNKNVNSGNSNVDVNNRNVNVNNNSKNVNVNNSKNVNVNVNKTVVVANPRPYPRPPYVYGGHSYYAYHPYYYHPYHPYPYPAFHPVGFFMATMAVTAVMVTVATQQYYYDQGVYYVKSNNGYTVVQAPVGATVTTIPPGSQTVVINETTNNYYYGGTYYQKTPEGYTVVPPTAGSVVENLPEGGQEVKVGENTYVKVGDTYYQPIQKDGKSMYEVVEVKEEK